MTPGDCFVVTGSGSVEQQVDAAVGEGRMHPGDGEAIVAFAEFLRLQHEHGPWGTWPPNLLRQWREYLGLTHTEIDQVEAALWRSELARPETEAGA